MCFQLCSVTLCAVFSFLQRVWPAESGIQKLFVRHLSLMLHITCKIYARPCALLRGPAFLMPLYHALKILSLPKMWLKGRFFYINPYTYISVKPQQFKHDKQWHLLRIPFPISSVSDGYSEMEISPKSNACCHSSSTSKTWDVDSTKPYKFTMTVEDDTLDKIYHVIYFNSLHCINFQEKSYKVSMIH